MTPSRLVGIIATREIIALDTEFVYPPIPIRTMDWSAIDSNTFDADWDGENYVTDCPQGAGTTEIEAINDLFDQMEGWA